MIKKEQVLHQNIFALNKEVQSLKLQNEQLLAAQNIDSLSQAEDRLAQMKDNMVKKLDEFLTWKYKGIEEELDLKKAEELRQFGGERIFKEVIGEITLPDLFSHD